MLKFAAKALKEHSDQRDVVALLIKRLKGFEKDRSHKQVHVSDLTKEIAFCPRQFAIYDALHRQPKDVYISAPLRVAFDQGKSLEDLCRNSWLVNDVVGNWKCLACGKIIYFCKRPLKPCPKCGYKLWRYKECEFDYVEAGVSGSIDFLLDYGLGKHSVYEAKSMDKDIFEKLKAPLAEHRIRTICYLFAIANSNSLYRNRLDLSEGRILYISKAFGKKSIEHSAIVPWREFVIKRDDATAKQYFEPAIQLQKFRKGGTMPDLICPTPQCTRAQACNVVKECFSGKL